MKIKKIVISISILLITILGITIADKIADAKSAITYQIQAQPADELVESMGINTKFGYCPGRLCDNYLEVKELLAELGIRYIRDIPYPEPWRIRKDLYQDLGIKMAADIVRTWGQPLDEENIASQLTAIKKWGKMIVGIVGINEYDNPVFQSCEQTRGCDRGWSEEEWPKKYTRFQQKAYQAVKSDRDLQDLPVVLGPMAYLDNIKKIGDVSHSCDKGNDHSYPGAWSKPSQESGGLGNRSASRPIDKVVAIVQQVCPDKKLWITETGYQSGIESEPNKYIVSPQAKAKYLPRIYANYFERGIEKTFLFELLEPTGDRTAFGIIDVNFEPTPAYYGIKNLISLLGEASWDRKEQIWHYPTGETDFLKYTLHGNLQNLKHLLLQKSDKTFYLLIWQEVYAYDNQLYKNITHPDREIKLQLNDAIIKSAKTYRLYNAEPSAKLSPLETWTNVSKLSLTVPDDILIVEFRSSARG